MKSSALAGWKKIHSVILLCVISSIALPAQTFKSLIRFSGKNGSRPQSPLVQGLDGDLYGTTDFGGPSDRGTVFRITPGGTRTLLANFCKQPHCPDGAYPMGGLVLATDGNFYGTTSAGGTGSSYGTVFRMTPAGALTTLYSFTGLADGEQPMGTLVQATDGNLYGVAFLGGANNSGTVFRITLAGSLTTLYSFCAQANCIDGDEPVSLIQGTDGNFYGTTGFGGYVYGTVFKITPEGDLTTLYRFTGSDGAYIYAGLVLANDGSFYGQTFEGGSFGCGTIFRITAIGKLTTLHNFDMTDGCYPFSALIQATDGNLYGSTSDEVVVGMYGTLFEITPTGVLTTLHSFDSSDGAQPGTLVQSTNGAFYGTSTFGGLYDQGTLYSLSVGLFPFADTIPTSGTVGSPVIILGMNLTGASSVTFNGTAASFTVVSDTEITTTVPAGATTGKVKVSKPSGSLWSNVVFTVSP